MAISADPVQLASSEANRSGSTLFAKVGYIRVQQDKGLTNTPQPLYSRPRWLSWMRRPTGDQEVAGSTPAEVSNILSWRLIIFSTVIFSLPLIQEGQLSVSGERMCTILVNRLED